VLRGESKPRGKVPADLSFVTSKTVKPSQGTSRGRRLDRMMFCICCANHNIQYVLQGEQRLGRRLNEAVGGAKASTMLDRWSCERTATCGDAYWRALEVVTNDNSLLYPMIVYSENVVVS
jgi:hypothetical protein